MTKLNYIFIIALASILLGAILSDAYGTSNVSTVLIIGGSLTVLFTGCHSLGKND